MASIKSGGLVILASIILSKFNLMMFVIFYLRTSIL